MSKVNLKLLPLKLLLFFLYAGFGCIAPFLTLHMFSIGMSLEEVTWINTALPLAVLAGPPIAGYLADRFGHYKIITIVSMLLAAVFYTSLLFVPHTPSKMPVTLICGSNGSFITFPSCTKGCPNPADLIHENVILEGCHLECPLRRTSCSAEINPMEQISNNLSQVSQEVTVGAPPTLCFNKTDSTGNCRVMSENSQMKIVTHYGPVKNKCFESKCCEYSLHSTSTDGAGNSTLTCSQNQEACRVVCNVKLQDDQINLLKSYECSVATKAERNLTFWLYFLFRVLADMFPAILISLLDAVALTMIAQYGGDFGRQKLLGLVAIGISSPIVGYLTDAGIGVFGDLVYLPVFYAFDFLMILTALLTLKLPIEVEIQRSSLMKNLSELLRTQQLNLLFLIATCLGMMWAFLETFLYVHLKNLNASKLLLGLTVTVGIIPSIPFLYHSDSVVSFCGHHYLLILGFVGYSIRFAGLSFMVNPWWVMPLEALELFSLNLVQVACATLAFQLAPKKLVCTAQALVWMSHFNIGRSIGTFLSGYLMNLFGIYWVFRAGAVFSAVIAAVYLALHTLFKNKKKRQNALPTNQEQKPNGNVANGAHYMPLPVDAQRSI